MPRRFPFAAAPSPSTTAGGQTRERLIRERHRVLARARRQQLGFWRSLGRSNRLFPRKLIVTREGKWIIGITLLLGAGAVNTGNNLLYLVLSLCISVIAVSGILSEWNLQGVSVRRHFPAELTLGEAMPLRLEVHNGKRRSALHIEVGELVDDPSLEARPGYLLQLAPREVGQAFAQLRAMRRGPIATVGLQIATAYPFGFARKVRLHDTPAFLLSLPNVAHVDMPRLGMHARGTLDLGRKAGQGDAFRALRDARAGDSLRDIHWKVSARRERLIAREWEAEASRLCLVRFVNVAPDADSDVTSLDGACATVAGFCAAMLNSGLSVGLETLHGHVSAALETAHSSEQLLRIRRHLAQLTLADRHPPASWPVSDQEWVDLALRADAIAAEIALGATVSWPRGRQRLPAEQYVVRFGARSDVHVAVFGHVEVLLAADGAIAAVLRPDARGQGAA